MLLFHTSQENYLYCPGPGPVSFEWNLTAPCGLTLQRLKALAEPCAQQRRERENKTWCWQAPLIFLSILFSFSKDCAVGRGVAQTSPDCLPWTHLPPSGTHGWPGVALASFLSVEKDKKLNSPSFGSLVSCWVYLWRHMHQYVVCEGWDQLLSIFSHRPEQCGECCHYSTGTGCC